MFENSVKKCSKCNEIKELNGFSRQKKSKDGFYPNCKDCYSIYQNQWYQENRKQISRRRSIIRKENIEKDRKQQAISYIKHREKRIKFGVEYRKKMKQQIAIQVSKWKKENSGKVNSTNSKTRASKLQRTPNWLTEDQWKQIKNLYNEASRLTKETGIEYHVDHIIPLQGKEVCGLHVPWNLQILVGYGPDGNCAKGNRIK